MSTLGAVWVGVSSFAAALAPTFPLLVLFRALGGIGSALFFASLLSFLLRVDPVTTHRSRDERVLRVLQHRLHRRRAARRADGEVVRPREPALHLRGGVLPVGGPVLAHDPRPRAPRVRGAPRRPATPAVEPGVRHRARRERRLPVDDRRDLPDAGPAVRHQQGRRTHAGGRGSGSRDRHGDRARGAVPGRPGDRSAGTARRADPGARGARADHGGVRVRDRRRSGS